MGWAVELAESTRLLRRLRERRLDRWRSVRLPAERCASCLPDGLDDAQAAAIANPGMSAWLSLKERAGLQKGETVLILGATGVAGQLAIQAAPHLGAKRVIAAGRNLDGSHCPPTGRARSPNPGRRCSPRRFAVEVGKWNRRGDRLPVGTPYGTFFEALARGFNRTPPIYASGRGRGKRGKGHQLAWGDAAQRGSEADG